MWTAVISFLYCTINTICFLQSRGLPSSRATKAGVFLSSLELLLPDKKSPPALSSLLLVECGKDVHLEVKLHQEICYEPLYISPAIQDDASHHNGHIFRLEECR